MALRHQLLSLGYGPLRLAHRARRLGRPAARARLRVALFHDVTLEERDAFRAQLQWLAKRWTFVSATEFDGMMQGAIPIARDSVLLTFDDGFASNRALAEDILEPMGIRALFFVIFSFAALETREQQHRFIAKALYPPTSKGVLPPHLASMGAMSHADLRHLVGMGHTIGAHGATHARLSELTDPRELEREIVGCADQLRDVIGVEIEHFAFGFGDVNSFSPEALRVARSRFRYVYTGMRGDNAAGVPPWAVRRDTLAPTDSRWLMGAFLEGAADGAYRGSLDRFESWGSPGSDAADRGRR